MKALRHSLIFMLMTAIFLSGGLSRKVQAGIEAQTWLVQPVTAQGQSGIITNIQYIDEFGGDVIHASMADENGNLYLAGLTSYSWRDPIHPHSGGQRDIVVMKLDNQGNYVWHTFFGGSGDDYSTAITVDSSGVYVIGIAPGDMGYPPLHPASSDGDFMILKLDLNGAYLWHTYYPDNPSGISAIALDGQGGLFFTGMSTHAWGSPTYPHSGSVKNLTLYKLSTDGEYRWHSYYGGNPGEYFNDLALVSDGIILLGEDSYDHPYSGYLTSFFLLKIDRQGSYQWIKSYGGNGNEVGRLLSIDSNENIIVAGYAQGGWFDVSAPIHPENKANCDSCSDAFVLKLTPEGEYIWHTFHGGPDEDNAYALTLDSSGGIYIAGFSNRDWDAADSDSDDFGGSYILNLNSDGLYQWHTFCDTQTIHPSANTILIDGDELIFSGSANTGSYPDLIIVGRLALARTQTNLQVPVTSVNGEPISLYATVAAIDSISDPPLTGEVVFSDGIVLLGSAPLLNGQADLSDIRLSAGTHQITAAYQGTGWPSSDSAATNVKPSGSSITISASSSSVLIGSPVRLEITLNALPPGSGVPTGTVTLEPVELGARETSSSLSPPAAFPIINGTASILFQSLTLGEHRFQVSYSGDSFFTPSRSPVVSIQVEPHHWFIPFLTQTEEVSNRFLQDQ